MREHAKISGGVHHKLARFEVKYNGIFDFDHLYKEMKKWFDRHGFLYEEKIHKSKPPEYELNIEARRWDTGYRATVINVHFHGWNVKEVRVKIKGKEKKMMNARSQVLMGAKMILDWDDKFGKNTFTRMARDFIHKFIFFYKFFIREGDDVYYELLDFQKHVRNAYGMSLHGGAY